LKTLRTFKLFRSLNIALLLCTVAQNRSLAQNVNLLKDNPSAYKASLDSLKTIADPLIQEAIITRLEKTYPNDSFDNYKYSLVYNFATAKNIAKAVTYFKQLKGTTRVMAMVTVPLLVMNADVMAAEHLVDEELARSGNSAYDRQTLLDIRRKIMIKKGDYKKAFAAMKEYYDATDIKTPALTANYYYLMSKAGKFKEAFPELEKSVAGGVANEELKMELKAAFKKLNPGKDSEAYLAAIIKPFEDKFKAEVLVRMISKKAPDFKVTDVNGKTASLSDFKGKVVVLDFWATWCDPCKRALPAMQLTVDKYKADPDVKFLFIHTWEKTANAKEEAIKYLADNKFRLPLFMDLKEPGTGKNPAVFAFGVMGIPAKFIIDGKGNIRFIAGGFNGSNEGTVNELSAMIELSRT
jgi:thiol-disulfide isomerase/thioredoxin